MSRTSFVRFTPQEYQALRGAAESLDLGAHPNVWRGSLANALRAEYPSLADRIVRLGKGQVAVVLAHLREAGTSRGEAEVVEGEPSCGLTVQEWQVVWRASQVVRLHEDPTHDFPERLLREVAETAPRLAAKLIGFSADQLATVYRRVKSGRRWCP